MNQIRETKSWRLNGLIVLSAIATLLISGGLCAQRSIADSLIVTPILFAIAMTLLGLGCVLSFGFFVVQPNQAQVLILLGNYIGSIRQPGFYWTIPWIVQRQKISLRVRNFNSDFLKVNDEQGSPIEIGAVIVWRVIDSAKAVFDVEAFKKFVAIQSETAIRALANRYPCDIYDDDTPSLRSQPEICLKFSSKRLRNGSKSLV